MAFNTETKAERWALPVRFGPATRVAATHCALLATLLFCAAGVLWPSWAISHVDEGGFVEVTSAVMLFLAALAALLTLKGLPRIYISLGCFLLAEREIDTDIFVADNPLVAVFVTLDSMLEPTWVRLLLGGILIFGTVWHGIPTLWKAWKARAPFLSVFALAVLAVVVAQFVDEIARPKHTDFSKVTLMRLYVVEETLEMLFSIGIFASVLIGWRKSSLQERLHDTPFAFKSDDSRVPLTNK